MTPDASARHRERAREIANALEMAGVDIVHMYEIGVPLLATWAARIEAEAREGERGGSDSVGVALRAPADTEIARAEQTLRESALTWAAACVDRNRDHEDDEEGIEADADEIDRADDLLDAAYLYYEAISRHRAEARASRAPTPTPEHP